METAKAISHEAYYKTDDAAKKERVDHGKRSCSRSAVESMVRLAQPKLEREPSSFDREPMLFNVENGTIDLRSGQLRPHDPGDCISKISRIAFDPDAKCPEFMRFLVT